MHTLVVAARLRSSFSCKSFILRWSLKPAFHDADTDADILDLMTTACYSVSNVLRNAVLYSAVYALVVCLIVFLSVRHNLSYWTTYSEAAFSTVVIQKDLANHNDLWLGLLGGDTAIPGGLHARLCHPFIVFLALLRDYGSAGLTAYNSTTVLPRPSF